MATLYRILCSFTILVLYKSVYMYVCMYVCAAFNKATKVLGVIKRTFRFKNKTVMMSLYKTLVRPHVEYCISAWNPHYIKDKELLEKVQRTFTKMINNTIV